MKSKIVITAIGKICTRCERDLPLAEYYAEKTGTLGLRAECKSCWSTRISNQYKANKERVHARNKAWRAANPERQAAIRRRSRLRRMYGISIEDYGAMLADQGGKCAGCGGTSSGDRRYDVFAVDHDHQTGEIRGLLCAACNLALGLLNDSPERLMALVAYLLQHMDVLAEGAIGASS
ncbi:hypothetical protein Ssi03_76130 [Sphaerisporangium siamense]|uniref:Recombination endonuclease VII n=1 Tax=Sphaerisporangium siamense TaxID=795645 RepID=A0A7W7G691_9ACTN|nr:endonuclease VII domain-containing protein [Sphaerisporangium siamense]MBB4699293.1 hypothetical protein [Sphaerisporangium siamense]GII89623.1 hypothetical protein Ssi03_76130 [Sphaerisporangium siamense]